MKVIYMYLTNIEMTQNKNAQLFEELFNKVLTYYDNDIFHKT